MKFLSRALLEFLIILLAIIASSSALTPTSLSLPQADPPEPYVSIGCDQVLWTGLEFELLATTRNIKNPEFEWTINGTVVKQAQKLAVGKHEVTLNVSFSGQSLQARKSVIIIDTAAGITMSDSRASNNQWRFQTLYRGYKIGVADVVVSVGTFPPKEVDSCGALKTAPLFAGEYAWQANYRGSVIASGTFVIEETREIRINSVEVAPRYRAGDTVMGNIVVVNSGSTTINEFEIETLVVNHKYEWMGDKAKRAYYDTYDARIDPGGTYKIPIRVTIPEKISGVRPSGSYSITIGLKLDGRIVDTKVVNTEVI